MASVIFVAFTSFYILVDSCGALEHTHSHRQAKELAPLPVNPTDKAESTDTQGETGTADAELDTSQAASQQDLSCSSDTDEELQTSSQAVLLLVAIFLRSFSQGTTLSFFDSTLGKSYTRYLLAMLLQCAVQSFVMGYCLYIANDHATQLRSTFIFVLGFPLGIVCG